MEEGMKKSNRPAILFGLTWHPDSTQNVPLIQRCEQERASGCPPVGGSLIHLLLVVAVIVLIINLIQGRRGL